VVSFLGQYFDENDLQLFQNKFNLPQTPIEKIIGPNDGSPGTEALLDVQYLTGIPGNIRTWVYSTTGTRPGDNEPFLKWLMEVESEQESTFLLYNRFFFRLYLFPISGTLVLGT
jgi:peptidoglycan hydrolase-like protein with peptidoglycan-binding domain